MTPVPCTPPDSSVHGITQARVLERVAISFSRGSSHLCEGANSHALQADSLPLSHLLFICLFGSSCCQFWGIVYRDNHIIWEHRQPYFLFSRMYFKNCLKLSFQDTGSNINMFEKMYLSILCPKKNQIKIIMRYHCIYTKMVKINKTLYTKCTFGCGTPGALICCC